MEEISPTSCELSCAATPWRRTAAIHFRFNGARATEYRSCGVRNYKGTCFRSGRFLEFAATAFVELSELARMVVAKVSASKVFEVDRPESTYCGHSGPQPREAAIWTNRWVGT